MATVAMPTVVVAILLTSVKSCIDKLQLPFGNGLVFFKQKYSQHNDDIITMIKLWSLDCWHF